MKHVYGYVRVSDPKQGKGVSLGMQQAAINRYATQNNLTISAWFSEKQSAAKSGRRQFSRMIEALDRGEAEGVIFHKVDRGARNFRDWADLGDLIDRGVEVHLAHETLDLKSRGGRLSADIQAVIAADFIRNLKQEIRKGIDGRLKQGLYPRQAPVGYKDCGKGRVKEIDPVQGPLAREAFELYASGEYSFEQLCAEMDKRGMRGLRDSRVTKNTLSSIFNNPFYYGLIHVKATNQTFEGVHAPLITKDLFDRVQLVLRGIRLSGSKAKHKLLFRLLIRCEGCGSRLIGERQKGQYAYYRCHNRACKGASLSERTIDVELSRLFGLLRLRPDELSDMRDIVDDMGAIKGDDRSNRIAALRLRVDQYEARLDRLAEVLIDGSLDTDTIERKKREALNSKRELVDQIKALQNAPSETALLWKNVELANTAYLQYARGNDAEKRFLLQEVTSNFSGAGNKPAITLRSPFQELAEWRNSSCGAPQRDNKPAFASKILAILGGVSEEEISAATVRLGAKRSAKIHEARGTSPKSLSPQAPMRK